MVQTLHGMCGERCVLLLAVFSFFICLYNVFACLYLYLYLHQFVNPPSQDSISGLHYTVSTQAQCSNNATTGGESIPGVELQVWGSCCKSMDIHISAMPLLLPFKFEFPSHPNLCSG